MPNTVEATWQDMQQKAQDELVRGEPHGLVTLWPLDAVILVFEVTPLSPDALAGSWRWPSARVASEFSQYDGQSR